MSHFNSLQYIKIPKCYGIFHKKKKKKKQMKKEVKLKNLGDMMHGAFHLITIR